MMQWCIERRKLSLYREYLSSGDLIGIIRIVCYYKYFTIMFMLGPRMCYPVLSVLLPIF